MLCAMLVANFMFVGCKEVEISINPATTEMMVGEEFTLVAAVQNGDLSDLNKIIWMSENPSSVEAHGEGARCTIVAKSAGETTIKASLDDKYYAQCVVTVIGTEEIPSKISMKQGKTSSLTGKVFEEAQVECENDFIAMAQVDATGKLQVEGKHVGETSILITPKEGEKIEIAVEVQQNYDTYEEPPFQIGASKATVLSEMQKLGYTRSTTHSNDSMYVYTLYSTSTLMTVNFNQQGKVESVALAFTDEDVIDELPNFLSERYELNETYTTIFSHDTYIDAYEWLEESKLVIVMPFDTGSLSGMSIHYRKGLGSSNAVNDMSQQLVQTLTKM